MLVADRLELPSETQAVLFDMDGVLLDTLTMDYLLVNDLLHRVVDPDKRVDREAIRRYFPLSLPEFWQCLLDEAGASASRDLVDRLVDEHEVVRKTTEAVVHDGVREILEGLGNVGVGVAVVSNNPLHDIEAMLEHTKLLEHVVAVVGTDDLGGRRKPDPEPYLQGARKLGVPPARCVSIEDSLIGAASGFRAGCFSIGVATGAGSMEALAGSPFTDRVYTAFAPIRLHVAADGGAGGRDVRTPFDALDQCVRRFGEALDLSVQISWTHDGFFELGQRLAREVWRALGGGAPEIAPVAPAQPGGQPVRGSSPELADQACHLVASGIAARLGLAGPDADRTAHGASWATTFESLAASVQRLGRQ